MNSMCNLFIAIPEFREDPKIAGPALLGARVIGFSSAPALILEAFWILNIGV